MPSETGWPSGLRASSGAMPGLVEAVAELVQRGEVRDAEVVQVVARGDAHVAGPSDCANGCGAGSRRQPSASKPTASSTSITARRWSSTSNGPEKTPLLRASPSSPAVDATSVDEVVAKRLEQRPQLGGGEPGLEVVEQEVVGVLGGLEARDVAVAQLDVARERVAEEA